MNDAFELPSLEEIEEMERQRTQAIESGMAVPIVGKLTRIHNDRIAVLQKRIKWIENYRRGNNTTKDDISEF